MNLWRGSPFGRRRAARSRRAHAALIAITFAWVAWFGAPLHSRQAAGAPAGQAEVDPITCWWKTDKNAVRVGERLTLALTCAVVETDAVRVVVDPARLDPVTLNLTPFEVLDGARHRDVLAPPRRYFQYSYTLRLLGDDFFGRDVDVPSVPVTYRVQSKETQTGEGRDQVYLLPALPVRVVSLVPVTANDINDASPQTFADIEALDSRATRELAAAGVLLTLAVLFAAVAVVRVVGRSRRAEPATAARLSPDALLHACTREVERIQSEAAAGWTADLVGRALMVFRIAAATSLSRPVVQRPVDRREQPGQGQLAVDHGWLRSQRHFVSSSATAASVGAWLAREGEHADTRTREALEDIVVPLQVFGGAHYGRSVLLDAAALDAAFDRGVGGLHRLNSVAPWQARAIGRLARTAAAVREATWAR